MTTEDLQQLEALLIKYLNETTGPLGIEKIKPCLNMVREQYLLKLRTYSRNSEGNLD